MKSFLDHWGVRSRYVSLAVLVLFSSLALSLSPWLSSRTNASGAFPEVHALQLGGDHCAVQDWTTTWSDRSNWLSAWDAGYYGSNFTNGINDFFDALEDNVANGNPNSSGDTSGWAVSQGDYEWSGGAHEKTITVWIFDPNATLTSDVSDANYMYSSNNSYSTHGFSGSGFYAMTISLNPNAGCRLQMNDGSFSTGGQYSTGKTNTMTSYGKGYASPTTANSDWGWFFIATDNINYNGHSGTIPSVNGPKDDKHPDFTYTVNDKDMTAHYTGPSCIVNPEVEGQCVPFKLFWSTTNGSDVSDSKDLAFGSDYTFTYPHNDTYSVFVKYIPLGVPYAGLPEIYSYSTAQAQFIVDGTDFTGDTTTCSVTGDYCVASTVVDCTTIENFFDQITCKMKNQFNVGLINPSINAFKTLFSSMVVPDSPTCGITMANAVISGQTFNVSSFGTAICTKTATIRSAFPILPVIINFVFAIALLYLIVRLINSLTKPDQHDIIVGVK